MNNVERILDRVKSVAIYPQVVIDSIVECDNSPETMHALEDADLRMEMIEKAGFLIIAVNLAQTLAIDPGEFEELISKVAVASEDERVKKVQAIMFDKLSAIAENEYISKGILPSVLERRMGLILKAIH